jgi:hypothetical protein
MDLNQAQSEAVRAAEVVGALMRRIQQAEKPSHVAIQHDSPAQRSVQADPRRIIINDRKLLFEAPPYT